MTEEIKKDIKRLLSLLTRNELSNVAVTFSLSEDADLDLLIDQLSELPRYQLVRIFLLAASPTLDMLKDVFTILIHFQGTMRTTGCIFMLADPHKETVEIDFSPQTIAVISDWTKQRDWSLQSESFTDLRYRWQRLQPVLYKLLEKAEPFMRHGKLDILKSDRNGRLIYKSGTEFKDKRAGDILKYFLIRVSKLVQTFESLPRKFDSEQMNWILRDAKRLLKAGEPLLGGTNQRHLSPAASDSSTPSRSEIEIYTSRRFEQDFDKFLEEMMLLGDLIEGEGLLDLLRLDIWSKRSQLYEIWVLMYVLRWFLQRGYEVELCKFTSGIGVPIKWNLSYSKDTQPCAIIRTLTHELFVFYQLYRSSGDMPDISLLEGPRPGDSAIWSIDPKHSEVGGYSKTDYQRTAERYRNSFGSRWSFIVEYFYRSDIGLNNPTDFGGNAFMFHDCRPGGKGMELLYSKLAQIHPMVIRTLICIDFSESFEAHRKAALSGLRLKFLRHNIQDQLLDNFVCFAGTAFLHVGLSEWVKKEYDVFLGIELSPGTMSEPLLEVIKQISNKYPALNIILVTDGKIRRFPIVSNKSNKRMFPWSSGRLS